MKRFLLGVAKRLINWHFVGKTAYRVRPAGDGIMIVSGEGKFIGAGLDVDKGTFVLRFLENGHGWQHSRPVDYRDVRRDPNLKAFVFND